MPLTNQGSLSRGIPALVVLCAFVLSGCSLFNSNSDDGGDSGACGYSDPGCYNIAEMGGLYCMVRQARQIVRKGNVRLQDLPGWVDRRTRDGAPLIVDFRKPEGVVEANLADQLRTALRAQGQNVNLERASQCHDSLTQEVIVKSEGGPPQS